MVRSQRQLDRVLIELENALGIVLYTVLDLNISQRLENRCLELGIPCVGGVPNLLETVHTGDLLLVNGTAGTVVITPDAQTLQRYENAHDELQQSRDAPAYMLRLERAVTDSEPCARLFSGPSSPPSEICGKRRGPPFRADPPPRAAGSGAPPIARPVPAPARRRKAQWPASGSSSRSPWSSSSPCS